MSDSVRPQRQQPTRLPYPWYSPGKNTGVGCRFLLQSMKVKSESEVAQSCPTRLVITYLPRSKYLLISRLQSPSAVILEPPKIKSGEGNGTALQLSCLENPMDRGAWWAAVHGVAKSWTRLSDFPFTFHFHALEKEMATHSSVLAWRIPGAGEPGGLPSMGLHRVGHD